MSFIRFFLGQSWWTIMYMLTYGWLAVTVGLILLMFGQDLKQPGQTPDLQSPASILVLMICCGLAVMTLCFVGVGVSLRAGPGWGVAAAIVCGAIVLIGDGYLNLWLAETQSVRAFYVNLVVAAVVILLNLLVMHLALNRPAAAPPPLPTVLVPAS